MILQPKPAPKKGYFVVLSVFILESSAMGELFVVGTNMAHGL